MMIPFILQVVLLSSLSEFAYFLNSTCVFKTLLCVCIFSLHACMCTLCMASLSHMSTMGLY